MKEGWILVGLGVWALAGWLYRVYLSHRWQRGGRCCESCAYWTHIEMDCGECCRRNRYVWARDKACQDWREGR